VAPNAKSGGGDEVLNLPNHRHERNLGREAWGDTLT